MIMKVFDILCIVVVVKAIFWCNKKCICQEQNRKVYCRNVNRNYISRQPEFTREILLNKSLVGLCWFTTVLKSLDSVRISDSVILDCNVSKKLQ